MLGKEREPAETWRALADAGLLALALPAELGGDGLGVAEVAETLATARINELLNWQVAASSATGPVAVADASAIKIVGSERIQRLTGKLEEIVAIRPTPKPRNWRGGWTWWPNGIWC